MSPGDVGVGGLRPQSIRAGDPPRYVVHRSVTLVPANATVSAGIVVKAALAV